MVPQSRNGLLGGKKSLLLAVLGVVLLLSRFGSCADIHRAKTHTGKVSPYPGREKGHLDGGEAVWVSGDSTGSASEIESSDETQPEPGGLEGWVCALLATILVGMTGIFPLLLPIDIQPDVQNGDGAARFKCLLSFAVGGLLGDVFLHLMPEAWSHVPPEDHSGQMRIGVWVLTGIFAFLVLEKIFGESESDHREESGTKGKGAITSHDEVQSDAPTAPSATTDVAGAAEHGPAAISPPGKPKTRKRRKTPESGGRAVANGSVANGHAGRAEPAAAAANHRAEDKNGKVKVIGYLNLLANFIDNFTHGLAVAGSFLISKKVGLLTTAAILLHEVPHEIGDFAILLRSGFGRWQAAKAQVFTATGGLCGALLALTSESAEKAGDSAAWILPFTSGGFLNIALVTVLPDLLEETNPRESVKQVFFLLSGVAVMGAVNLIAE